jgi:Protein of unknown function (DUF2510)
MTAPAPGRAGWYPDPAGRFDTRYWDGGQWTSAVRRGEQVESDPDSPPSSFSGDGITGASATATPPPSGSDPPRPKVAPPPFPHVNAGDRLTSLPVDQAQREVARVLPLAGIVVKGEQPGQVQAAVPIKGQTNVALVIILCFICLLPGIIYAITSSRVQMHPVIINLAPSSSESTVITIQAPPVARQSVLTALGNLPW